MIATALESVKDLLGGEKFPGCESPSLRLEKFVRIGNALKGEEIDAVIACAQHHGRKFDAVIPANAVSFKAKLEGNLIINQAGGILENAGMCLDTHFGMPYIPGSAVKGVARHAAWCEWNEEEDETKKFQIAKDLADVFGYPTGDKELDKYLDTRGCGKTSSGSVCFMQAVPEYKPKLVKDIVNCHHKAYYADPSGMVPPYDNEDTNPQFFPSVEKGTRFIFTIVPVRGCGDGKLESAKRWLITAITVHGIGAKTAAGYGWFSYDEAEAKREEEERLRDEAKAKAKREQEAREAAEKEKEEAKRAKREAMTDDDYRDAVLDRWKDKKPKQIMKSGDISGFGALKDENTKKGIVLALRMSEGKGAEVWAELKTGQKGDIANGVNAIRKYCKDVMGLGKMP